MGGLLLDCLTEWSAISMDVLLLDYMLTYRGSSSNVYPTVQCLGCVYAQSA